MGNYRYPQGKEVQSVDTKVETLSDAELRPGGAVVSPSSVDRIGRGAAGAVREEISVGNAGGFVQDGVVGGNVEGVLGVNHNPDDLNFGTPEQLREDEQAWRTKFAATTPEQLAALEAMFLEDEKEGTTALEFSKK
jgi:hypothetical protein